MIFSNYVYLLINIWQDDDIIFMKIVTVPFFQNGIPAIGLTPTISIYELSGTFPYANTLIVSNDSCDEIGLGWYRYNFSTYDPTKNYVFTIDGGNTLSTGDRYKCGGNESYVEDISSEVWNETLIDHIDSGSTGEVLAQTKANTATLVVNEVTIFTLLDTLLKYQRNRTKIDLPNNQLIIYDDDCVTPLTTFNLKDFNGMPSVAEVCERIPTTC